MRYKKLLLSSFNGWFPISGPNATVSLTQDEFLQMELPDIYRAHTAARHVKVFPSQGDVCHLTTMNPESPSTKNLLYKIFDQHRMPVWD